MRYEYRNFSLEHDARLFTDSETGEVVDSDEFEEFVESLDDLRDISGFAFKINSGYRSSQHSKEKVKAKPGEHNRAAADVAVNGGVQRLAIVEYAIKLGFTGIGIAKTFVHVDRRKTTPVLWVY